MQARGWRIICAVPSMRSALKVCNMRTADHNDALSFLLLQVIGKDFFLDFLFVEASTSRIRNGPSITQNGMQHSSKV